MELNLRVLKNYRVDMVHLTPFRDRYTVVELDANNEPTDRSWSEPYNSRSGDPDELVARFNKRIAGDNAPAPDDYTELTLFASALANEGVEANKPLVVSAVRRCLNECMEQTIEMCDLLAGHKEASPKQVILEASMDKLTGRILDILRRAVAKGARDAADQTQHPYETIREAAQAISSAVAELEAAAEHYKLSRWKRLKSVFARDKDATS